jgi:hypothetical protein
MAVVARSCSQLDRGVSTRVWNAQPLATWSSAQSAAESTRSREAEGRLKSERVIMGFSMENRVEAGILFQRSIPCDLSVD